MTTFTLPTPNDCPTCGRPLVQVVRFSDDGVALLTRVCDACGQVSAAETAPASSVVGLIQSEAAHG